MRTKVILWTLTALVGVALLLSLSLDTLISLGVEDVVGSMTGVPVRCGHTDFSLLRGQGIIDGLTIDNPPGFSATAAITIDRATFSVDKTSLFSRVVVVPELVIEDALIRFEPGAASGPANVDALLTRVRASAQAALAGHPVHNIRLAIGELVVRGAKVEVNLKGLAEPIPDIAVPDIVLADLGSDAGGVSGEAVFESVFDKVHDAVMRKIEDYIPGLAAPESPTTKDVP